MTPNEMREQDVDSLRAHEAKLRKELFNLRFQAVVGSLENPSQVQPIRREVAQVLTILNEKAKA